MVRGIRAEQITIEQITIEQISAEQISAAISVRVDLMTQLSPLPGFAGTPEQRTQWVVDLAHFRLLLESRGDGPTRRQQAVRVESNRQGRKSAKA
jgi:hypothetical protein